MLALSLSGFALGGCGGSHRQSGTSGTEYFGGSVIFRLRPPTIGADVTRVDVSERA